jgi:hypothetical protein
MPRELGGAPGPVQVIVTPKVTMFIWNYFNAARRIYTDGRPHPDEDHLYASSMGHSIGHWEGDTLVVETTNLPKSQNFAGAWENLKVTERFARTAKDRVRYSFTVDDPTIWDKPWGGEYEFAPLGGVIYEYACHEGNYALPGILGGARAEEKEKAEAKTAAPKPGAQ